MFCILHTHRGTLCPWVLPEIRADQLAVGRPRVAGVRGAVRPHETTAGAHEVDDRGLLLRRQGELTAGAGEAHDAVLAK